VKTDFYEGDIDPPRPGGAPFVSVVVPVRDGAGHLARCLDALVASGYERFEIVVVDDASSDSSAELAHSRGARVLRLARQSGPAAARNHGAARARGDVLLFIDADVEVGRDTLALVAAHFAAAVSVAAVFGSYDDAPAEPNFASQFKNLFHHFTHQRASRRASTFWAGCGAVRRELFLAAGGFDAGRYARPSVEDIELGYRLRRAGREIVLDRDIQVKHLKRWTLLSMLRADIRDRAVPWSRLIVEGGGMVNDLNLRVADRVSAALVCLAALALLLSALARAIFDAPPAPFVAASLALLTLVVALNLDLYRFFFRLRGARFAAAACAMHLLYFLYGATTFAVCWLAQKRRAFLPPKKDSRAGRRKEIAL
jgi:glycosyltransferase involved in cell wall biosynthesis